VPTANGRCVTSTTSLKRAGLLLGDSCLACLGETWCKSQEEAWRCDTPPDLRAACRLGPLCEHCGQLLRREELISEPSAAYALERQARRDAFKGSRAGALNESR
jgi:hypothetical protein